MLAPVSENVKKRKSVRRRSIYREFLSWSRLQKRGTKLKLRDVVLGTNHVVLLANGFPRLIVYVRPPPFFREHVA